MSVRNVGHDFSAAWENVCVLMGGELLELKVIVMIGSSKHVG